MRTYPNQKIIRIIKSDYQVNGKTFLQVGNEEWQEASKKLTPSAFKIYLYLASHQRNFLLALSKQDIINKIEISSTRYYEGIKELITLNYIIEDSNGKIAFYTSPQPNLKKDNKIFEWSEGEKSKIERVNSKMETDLPELEKEIPKTDREIYKIDNRKIYNRDHSKLEEDLGFWAR